MQVAKSIKSDQVDAAYRRRIFDSVGFSFINRLLITTDVPPGCDENVYRSLALTLLACYSTDPELAAHPQVVGKTAVAVEVLTDRYIPRPLRGDGDHCWWRIPECYNYMQCWCLNPSPHTWSRVQYLFIVTHLSISTLIE